MVCASWRTMGSSGHPFMSAPVGQLTIPLSRGFIIGRVVLDRRTIHVADMLAEADEYPESHQRALQVGYRTALAVPLVHAQLLVQSTDRDRPVDHRELSASAGVSAV